MSTVDKALETQLRNIQNKTGKSLDELTAFVKISGLTKHGQIRDMLKRELGLGYGDANTLTHHARKASESSAAPAASTDDAADTLYAGPKASLRPIHDKLMAAIGKFGQFEIAPKKNYLSLRRKKQFAMIGPATKSQVEVGLNVRDLPPSPRLTEQATGKMCQYKMRLSDEKEVDKELLGWIKRAFEDAG